MRHLTLKNLQIEVFRPQWAWFAGHLHRAKNILCALASRGIQTVSESQNLCRTKYFWDEGTIPYGFGEKSGAGKKSTGDFWRDGAVWHQFGNSKKQPNNAIHRMATRVTPRADSASLRWHESRHGQPSVIADVRKKHIFPRGSLQEPSHIAIRYFQNHAQSKSAHAERA
jgi:hypothetical protein